MKDKYKTKVAFRKFPEGDVIAIFPDHLYGMPHGYYLSYMHVGQHGDASPDLLKELEEATEQEYLDLKKELESIGYNLEVMK